MAGSVRVKDTQEEWNCLATHSRVGSEEGGGQFWRVQIPCCWEDISLTPVEQMGKSVGNVRCFMRRHSLLYWLRGTQSRTNLLKKVVVVEVSVENCCGWGPGTVREHRKCGTSAVVSRYQRTDKDKQTEKANCRLCRSKNYCCYL
jgi:hypothetical protein